MGAPSQDRSVADVPPALDPAPAERRPSLVGGLLRTARPKQWAKNVLVLAAPGAAGVLTDADALVRTAIAFAAFSLAASGAYFLNDASDAEADRRHPVKRSRPVAAGIVPVPLARAFGCVLIAAGVATGLLASWPTSVVVAVYVVLTTSYTHWLKDIAVVDLAAVAAGFVVRTVGGAVAADVPVSDWFLIVASFGSLFMVAGKRHAEHLDLGDDGSEHRATLGVYSAAYLRYIRAVSSGITITAYCLWAFEEAELTTGVPYFELTIVPFVIGILRYALLLDAGQGGAPEEIVLRDRPLQAIGLVWAIVFAIGVHGG